jgi:hypothetical protein
VRWRVGSLSRVARRHCAVVGGCRGHLLGREEETALVVGSLSNAAKSDDGRPVQGIVWEALIRGWSDVVRSRVNKT